MRLTNMHREEFVEDVMAGIPVEHKYNQHDAEIEIARAIEKQLPADVQAFAKKHPNLIQRTHQIKLEALKFERYDSFYKKKVTVTPHVLVINHPDTKLIDLTPWSERKRLFDEEQDRRNELRSRISQIAASCNTLKQLKEALPELESYMPEEELAKRNLPIAAGGVITDLLRAGLKVPKGEGALA